MNGLRTLKTLLGNSYHGITPVLAAAVLAYTLTGLVWPKLHRAQVYPEILLSGIAMADFDKDRDLLTLDLFLASAIGLALGLSATLRLLSREGPASEVGRALNTLLTLALIPACWRLGDALIRSDGHLWPKEAALCILVVWAIAVGLFRHRHQLSGPLVLQLGGATLVALALAFFDGMAAGVAAARLRPDLCIALESKARLFFLVPMALASVLITALYAASGSLTALRRQLYRLLFALQVPLPLLFGILIPPPLLESERPSPDRYSFRLLVLIGGLAVTSWCLLWRRYRRWRDEEHQQAPGAAVLDHTLAPLGLAAISLFLLMPALAYPQAFLGGDRFHEAEESPLFWQQWRDFGLRPYADLIPIHGLMPLSRGLLNDVFFDGTAAHQPAAELLLLAAAVLATFFTLSALATPLLALFVSFTCPVASRAYFLAPAVLVMVHPHLRQRPRLWLGVWIAVCVFSVLYNGAIGPAFALGTCPVAAWMVYRLATQDRARCARFLLVLAAVLVLAVSIKPVRAIGVGLVTFIDENRGTHAVGSGAAWEEGKSAPIVARDYAGSRYLFELIRFSWIGVVILAGVRFWQELARPPAEPHLPTLWLSVLLIPTLWLCSRWVVGTIDPASCSRTGIVAHVCVLYFLPLLLLARCHVLTQARVLAFLAVLITIFNMLGLDDHVFRSPHQGTVGCTEYYTLMRKPFAVRPLPAGTQVVEGAQAGFPYLGRVALKPDQWATLLEFKEAVHTLLKPGETFLDLTNSPIYYYYLGLPVPTLYAGDFAIVNRRQERRSLARLGPRPPAVALAGPPGMYPFNVTSVRSYPLYREFLLRYQPVQRGRFTFLVDPERRPDVPVLGKPASWLVLDQLFQWRALGKTAAAWGSSWRTLASGFEPLQQLDLESPVEIRDAVAEPGHWFRPTGSAPRVSYRLGDGPVNGADADYVKLDIDFERVPQGPEPWPALSWESDDGSPCSPLWVAAPKSTLLVPLGGTPSWLLNTRLRVLHITVTNPACCTRFRINGIQLLHLKPL